MKKGLCARCHNCTLKTPFCGGCSLCEAVACGQHCATCFALCPKRPQSIAYLLSLGGPSITLKSSTALNLPTHIPIFPDRFKTPPPYETAPFIAVHGGNMMARNGERINKSYLEKGFHGALNIDNRCEALLEFYVKDRTLEGFWDKRKSIYKDLKTMNFKTIISPNFSVYEDAPRLDHLCNIKRSTMVYNELLDEGLPAVPDVSWYNLRDLERWCDAIDKGGIKTIAFSFQVVDVQLKASNKWASYVLGFRYLCQNIDPDTKIIIAGLSSPRRLQCVFDAANGQSLHILNQSAYVQSRRGMLSETRTQDRERKLTMDQLLMLNISYFNEAYEKMNQERRNFNA